MEKRDGKRKKLEMGSTTLSAKGGGKVVKSVIVCGIRSEFDGYLASEDKYYRCFDFFRIDIDNINSEDDECPDLSPCFNSIASVNEVGAVSQVDKCIYLMSSFFQRDDPLLDSITTETTRQHVSCAKGLSCLNLFKDNNDTTSSSSSSSRSGWISCGHPCLYGIVETAALRGKIYSLESSYLESPMVYCPKTRQWSQSLSIPAPSEIQLSSLSGKMLPDHANARIFLHVNGTKPSSSGLYAWYPQLHGSGPKSWFRIGSSINRLEWRKKPTLADQGLIFFYFRKTENLFRVFDVEAKKWLKVEWLQLFPRFLERRVKAKGMFYLGNRKLCLAISTFVGDLDDLRKEHGSRITLVVFDYYKQCFGNADATITMNHLYTRNFYARGIIRAIQFTPLA